MGNKISARKKKKQEKKLLKEQQEASNQQQQQQSSSTTNTTTNNNNSNNMSSSSTTTTSSSSTSSSTTTSELTPQQQLEQRLQHLPRNENIGNLLRNVPLLSNLNDFERSVLGGALKEASFDRGENIVTQGEDGHAFYIIKNGSCTVRRSDHGETFEIARLKEGDFFGEAALLNDSKRGATVVADVDTRCYFLERQQFNDLLGSDKLNVKFAKRQAISAEKMTVFQSNNNNNNRSLAPANAVREKTPETINLLQAALAENVLFRELQPEHRNKIIAEMWKSDVKAGVRAITQGELGDLVYIIESGLFYVYVNQKFVATRGTGQVFGELALMYNSPRAATVLAAQNSTVWVIDRFSYRRIVTDLSRERFHLYIGFLKNVELLAPLAEYERKKIAEALEEVNFNAGEVIFRQGEEGDTMYIVYSGEVQVSKLTGEEETVLATYTAGGYFGERALLKNEARAATARAKTNCQVLKIDRNAFSLLLGPLEEIMLKKVSSEENNVVVPVQKKQAPVRQLLDIPFSQLKHYATLGKGSFGYVSLVVDEKTKTTYALKAVSKTQIVQTGQQGHVMSEKRAMMLFEHPFLIKLFQTYKDDQRLFFLLEPVLGGELFTILRELIVLMKILHVFMLLVLY